ncbi:hypothetical protein [Actinacidiphila acididurans]|uniref:Uncharacterized protein n=1 Tax=Actinacidiphila acididurans TaxID=2784346 RepID=A0ABS2TMG4_9ACTN|nr:hypothetical protein [Actinacidiphila acididurans]MBM9504508.1 hypothetical protein [Actinacidiphila acididurans]
MTGADVLRVRAVSKVYPGGVTALDRVSLTIGAGELLAVLGPSGSGNPTQDLCPQFCQTGGSLG